ncbi:hypothetical protein AZKH_1348 [Azoarcus sp. KH32C]|nr:hypothetical protein AZKH_1348 [Azoarcus sp. KH32C]
MARIQCSCGGENERCYKCDGRGWYNEDDDRDLLKEVRSGVPSYNAGPSLPPFPPLNSRRRLMAYAAVEASVRGQPKLHSKARNNPSSSKRGAERGRAITVKPGESSLYMESGGDTFPCTYPEHMRERSVRIAVSRMLGRVRRHIPTRKKRDFRAQYEVRAVHLRGNGVAVAVLKDLFSGQKVTVREDRFGTFVKREIGRSVQAQVEAEGRTAPREVHVVERSLDASRDYWRIRDHGQFGSHPSHDDYDE